MINLFVLKTENFFLLLNCLTIFSRALKIEEIFEIKLGFIRKSKSAIENSKLL